MNECQMNYVTAWKVALFNKVKSLLRIHSFLFKHLDMGQWWNVNKVIVLVSMVRPVLEYNTIGYKNCVHICPNWWLTNLKRRLCASYNWNPLQKKLNNKYIEAWVSKQLHSHCSIWNIDFFKSLKYKLWFGKTKTVGLFGTVFQS